MPKSDRLYLILSQQKLPDNQRKLEINDGPDGEKYYITKSEDNSITVIPWCFNEDEIKVYVETSHLSQVEFKPIFRNSKCSIKSICNAGAVKPHSYWSRIINPRVVREWHDFVGESNHFVYKYYTNGGERISDSQVN